VYTKVRTQFGKDVAPALKHEPAELLKNSEGFDGFILPEESEEALNKPRNPELFNFDTSASMSESEMNTDVVITKSTAMKHKEGGWPKEVDPTEKQDVTRFITKAQKQQEFKDSLHVMGPVITRCMRQNGTTDIYESYFHETEEDHSSTPPSAKVFGNYFYLLGPSSLYVSNALENLFSLNISYFSDKPTHQIKISISIF
jgi:dynein intermediate chain 2